MDNYKRSRPREETEARLLRERGTPEELIGPVVPDGTLYRCGTIVDPGAFYPHPCVLPKGHDGECDGRPPEVRRLGVHLW